jgi:hypothetical protein
MIDPRIVPIELVGGPHDGERIEASGRPESYPAWTAPCGHLGRRQEEVIENIF